MNQFLTIRYPSIFCTFGENHYVCFININIKFPPSTICIKFVESIFCRSSADSVIMTVSSAYNKIRSFKCSDNSFSILLLMLCKPAMLFSNRKFSRSLMYKENKKRGKVFSLPYTYVTLKAFR